MAAASANALQYLKGVGEKRAQLFGKLGVDSIDALVRFYPRAYEDWSNIVPIAQTQLGETACVEATVSGPVRERHIRKGMTLYQIPVRDESGSMLVTLFNTKYAAQQLTQGETFLFLGKACGNFTRREMTSPRFVPKQQAQNLRPIYRLTEGLHAKAVEEAVRQALQRVSEDLYDPLPEHVRREYGLCHLRYALQNIHFPIDEKALEVARRRLVFEELLVLQLGMLVLKQRSRSHTGMVVKTDYSQDFYRLLPFTPTGAQRRAVADAVQDMMGQFPMSRLVQGDVGSGKTAVAAAVCFTAVKNGFQCALMAPTEILAEQHFRSLSSLLQPAGIRMALLTGAVRSKQKREILDALAEGRLDFVVGTHALVQERVQFHALGLVVTDEQHRFGVAQRAALAQKGQNPHLLVMSATPIPRTLALMIYGDLDLSVLDELPPGRQKIQTYAVGTALRERVWRFVKKHLDAGKQAYLVCPLVEEGDSNLAAAEAYAQRLSQGAFAGYRVGLLHGRLKGTQKEEVMRAFSQGEIQLLISTTVVEVGVDVPNAVDMVIENAERFGLSQLHQLRGRVGRGNDPSTCILLSDAQNEEAVRRLRVMCETSDGFRIADEDLRLRGPGDFFGNRQHGLPALKIADMMTDTQVLRESQKAAREIVRADPTLSQEQNSGLLRAVHTLFEQVGEGGLN